jgi:hypothetical protein
VPETYARFPGWVPELPREKLDCKGLNRGREENRIPGRGDRRKFHRLPAQMLFRQRLLPVRQIPRAVETGSCSCTWDRWLCPARRPELRTRGYILCRCTQKSAWNVLPEANTLRIYEDYGSFYSDHPIFLLLRLLLVFTYIKNSSFPTKAHEKGALLQQGAFSFASLLYHMVKFTLSSQIV